MHNNIFGEKYGNVNGRNAHFAELFWQDNIPGVFVVYRHAPSSSATTTGQPSKKV